MANTEVGSAYVTIYPQTDGNFSKQVGKDMGDSVGEGVSAKAVALGNLLSTGLMKGLELAADGVSSVIGGALEGFKDYEQLTGGVETLFKDSAGQVEAYALQAYQTAGLSANEYMETVTSFSASLLQSLDGDTASAAQYADMAIRDMSDNANKMGSDMESIQNAYQGFAKQNYTMLDNLKLGYGGTKSEMERLLADAEAISGIRYDIDSYADVVDAIHVIQTSMDISGYSVEELNGKLKDMSLTSEELQKVADDLGISYDEASERMQSGALSAKDAQVLLGTTAKEAATTIDGSVKSMKAAWENWLTSLAAEDMDFGATTDALLDSVSIAASNVVPRLGKIVATIISGLPELGAKIAAEIPKLGGMFGDAFSDVFEVALGSVSPDVAEPVRQIIEKVKSAFEGLAPTVTSIVGNVGEVLEGMAPIVLGVASTVIGVVTEVLGTVMPVVDAIVGAVADNMPMVQALVGSVMNFVQTAVSTVMPIVQGIFEAVWPEVSGIVGTAVAAITSALDGLSALIGGVTATFNAIGEAITNPIETARGIIKGAIDTIAGIINGAHLELPHFALPHFVISGGELPWGVGGMGTAPSIDVQWYAEGAVFTKPAVLAGVGEGGEPEGVFPLSYLDSLLDRDDDTGSADVVSELRQLRDDIRNMRLYMDGREVGGLVTPYVNRNLGYAGSGRGL